MNRNELVGAWLSLEQTSDPADGMRFVPLPVEVPAGALCAGRDMSGNRHLLVPVPAGSAIQPDERSEAVQLRGRELIAQGKRRLLIDVVCYSEELEDLFERLAMEVCERLTARPAEALIIPARVLSRWRQLLELRIRTLGINQSAGLFGELHVLHQTVLADPSRRVDHWQADHKAVHDLRRGSTAIEVKTTTARTGRTLRIHGLAQLRPPDSGGRLFLAFVRLEKSPKGRSIDDLVGQLLPSGVDKSELRSVLDSAGFSAGDPSAPRFAVVEERWYAVDTGFPRLTPASFTNAADLEGVVRVEYDIDLAGPSPKPLSPEQMESVMSCLAAS